jgi:hypothetical protein
MSEILIFFVFAFSGGTHPLFPPEKHFSYEKPFTAGGFLFLFFCGEVRSVLNKTQ